MVSLPSGYLHYRQAAMPCLIIGRAFLDCDFQLIYREWINENASLFRHYSFGCSDLGRQRNQLIDRLLGLVHARW